MEAVGNLTGGLAHDFNNLLGAIIGNLDLLGDVLPAGSEQAEIAGDALHAALIGADLTRRLLAFARRQPLQPRATDLNDLVGGLSKMLRRILGEQIGFELNLAAEIRSILVDPAQLEAAITNLATNARDAMPRGGRLVIRTRNVELDAEYAAQNTDVAPGSYAEIAVSDTGTGMTPDIASQIFEPFFTTKEEGKGSGLGLSMVFGFVKQSGGHIAVESALGEGTVVRLYLPAADHDLPAEPRTKRAPAFVGGSETILVVEDNERMRGVVVRQLAGLGYRVIAVEEAGAALDLLAHEPSVDLLFSDIVMPGAMDGSELVRAVADRYAGIRILLTSGFSETRLAHDDAMLPGPRLLSKPYRLEELARTIREVLDAPNLQVPSKSPMAGSEIG
jgi:CheY-like chemotaxis protein